MVDRYTKLVLTVIAICLAWIALGGPSLSTAVEAQVGERVILAGWIDERGAFKSCTNRIGHRVGHRPRADADAELTDYLVCAASESLATNPLH